MPLHFGDWKEDITPISLWLEDRHYQCLQGPLCIDDLRDMRCYFGSHDSEDLRGGVPAWRRWPKVQAPKGPDAQVFGYLKKLIDSIGGLDSVIWMLQQMRTGQKGQADGGSHNTEERRAALRPKKARAKEKKQWAKQEKMQTAHAQNIGKRSTGGDKGKG